MSLSELQLQEEYAKNPNLKDSYGSFEKYKEFRLMQEQHQLRQSNVFDSDLKKYADSSDENSIMSGYNRSLGKFNERSAELIAAYQDLDPVYKAAKHDFTKFSQYIDAKGDNALGSEKSRLADLKKEADSSGFAYDEALSLALYHTHSLPPFLG
ncbi:MAG: hypothetical protein LBK53_02125 [Heliobacteriaceae bacterium]|jgi:hypothetical protein|nr:hypothetical protein [Heliobacteriaceae bacterium]